MQTRGSRLDSSSDWHYKMKLHRFIYRKENSIGRLAVPVCIGHTLSETQSSVTCGC